MIYMKYIKYIILFLIIFFIIYFIFKFFNTIERFEDKFDNFEKYEEIYDEEFINLYEIIYRDFSDIDYDTNIFYSKCFDDKLTYNDVSILVAGCGVGKLSKKIKEKYSNVIGIDVSENILKKAQILYPNVKYTRGNLTKENIFEKNKFSHIYFDERTLYYNNYNDIKKIIHNSFNWLKDEGYLIIPIYDPDKLQLASRYYSSKYIDDKGNVHGFTYLNDFSHDCYYIRSDEDNEIFNYYDKIVLKSGEKRIKKTTFYIPSKENIYDFILKVGFNLIYIEKIRIQVVGGYELAIFKKKKLITSVDEIEKNKLL
jgi:ubiquinone/menaquinone biosynthesis C-methylase UbiE